MFHRNSALKTQTYQLSVCYHDARVFVYQLPNITHAEQEAFKLTFLIDKQFSIHVPVRFVEQIIDYAPVRLFVSEEQRLSEHTIATHEH